MEVMVNGKSMELADGTTAAGLLEQLKIQPERVVVEVNLTIVKRDRLPSTVLKPGDQVEVVHFVGGGSVRLQTSDFSYQTGVCGLRSVV